MPKKKLSAKFVETAKRPKSGQIEYFDEAYSGFALRVTDKGRKCFVVFYRPKEGPKKGTVRRYTLEPAYPALTLAKAKFKAGEILGQVDEGRDPAAEKQAQKKAPPTAVKRVKTFGEAVEAFIELRAKIRQRTWKETRRTLRVNCAAWLDWPIAEITRADVYSLLDGFIADGHGYKAERTLSWLKTMFKWCAKREIITASFMDAIEIEFDERDRDRVFTSSEVKAVWSAMDGLVNDAESDRREQARLAGGYIKLLILLAVRKGELAGMRRSEFDDPDKPTIWTIPFERVKANKKSKPREYVVPLSKLAQRIIRSLPRADDDLVFPGRLHGRPLHPGTPLQSKVQEGSGIADWNFHACRHTVATWLKTQGRSEYERALVLNHSESSVTAGYSHGHAVDLKRELLEQWAGHVAGLVQPKGATRLA